MPEQRNRYKGMPLRPWISARLVALDGSVYDLELGADTASPCAVVIGVSLMNKFNQGYASSAPTNFGRLPGGWLQIGVVALGWEQKIIGHASDAMVRTAARSHPDFEGLVGLPFLRLFDYGGDANEFWIRLQAPQP